MKICQNLTEENVLLSLGAQPVELHHASSPKHRPSNLATKEVIQLLLRRHSYALLGPHIAIEEGAQQRRRRRRCYV